MKFVVLIPARSGSKRLPGKNIKSFNGKPLIWYSIQAGNLATCVAEVYISSDDDLIGEIGVNLGAKFLKRPYHISTDFSATADVLIHAAKSLNLSDDDVIVTLQPTNPLRPVYLIDEIFTFVMKSCSNWTSLITVSPLKKKIGILDNGLYRPYNYAQGQRSQDMEDHFFIENGLVYLTKVGPLLKSGNMFGEIVLSYKTPYDFSEVDIDTLADFKVAESMHMDFKQSYKLV